jgi:hypothetical protein
MKTKFSIIALFVAAVLLTQSHAALAKAATVSPNVGVQTSVSTINSNNTGLSTNVSTHSTADANNDGVVSSVDVGVVLSNWGPCIVTASSSCKGDLNHDNNVDNTDLGIVVDVVNNQGGIASESNTTNNTTVNTTGTINYSNTSSNNNSNSSINYNSFIDAGSPVQSARELIEFTVPGYVMTNYANVTVDEQAEMKARAARSDSAARDFGTILGRLQAGVARIDLLTSRIESRMKKMQAEGITVSAAATFIERAKTSNGVSRANTAGLQASFEAAYSESTDAAARAALDGVRNTISSTKSQLESARKSLLEAVRLMKASDARAQAEVGADIDPATN